MAKASPAKAHRDRRRRAAIANGTWEPQVPFDKVYAHLRDLNHFMSYTDLADVTGVPRSTIAGIGANPPRRRWVYGPIAKAILEVPPTPGRPAIRGQVNTVGIQRRIRALARLGLGLQPQADLFQAHRRTVQNIRDGGDRRHQKGCLRRIADNVVATYDDILTNGLPAPANAIQRAGRAHAAQAAEAAGWYGPDAWDEDTIDDPEAKPYSHLTDLPKPPRGALSWAAVWSALGGGGAFAELTTAERVEVIRVLADRGWQDERIGNFLRTDTAAICQFRRRHRIASRFNAIGDITASRQAAAADAA